MGATRHNALRQAHQPIAVTFQQHIAPVLPNVLKLVANLQHGARASLRRAALTHQSARVLAMDLQIGATLFQWQAAVTPQRVRAPVPVWPTGVTLSQLLIDLPTHRVSGLALEASRHLLLRPRAT